MIETATLSGLALPLAGFLILFFSSKSIGRKLANSIGCLSVFASLCSFSAALVLYNAHKLTPVSIDLYSLISLESLSVEMAFLVDPLSLLMTLIITGVGFLIHVYATGYMDHDSDYARFFACLNLFIFAMLFLVLGKNLVVLFIGWEGVGVASYLLIGFWYTRKSAASAAVKAFVVNRVGDLGLLLAILFCFSLFGTTDMQILNQTTYPNGSLELTIITLLLFIGAAGKSAQLPLHIWLPDAMEGPTPVSALIHAATMVTAGVYLIVRLHPLFSLTPTTMQIIGFIGGATSLFAALSAVGQTDLKRVLAYSTVSQLGLMFLACGVGAYFAAMLHLTMHAFMKALLFLSAGNVVHMMHGETEMGSMGGLKSIFSKTHWLFLIGVLAMAGIPPLAAYISKDLILEEELLAGHRVLFFVGLAASILTAYYLMRAYMLTFQESPRSPQERLLHLQEAPLVMLLPTAVLGLLSIIGGLLGFSLEKPPVLEQFLAQVGIDYAHPSLSEGYHVSAVSILATFGGLLGIAAALYLYKAYRPQVPLILKNGFYIDALFERLLAQPLHSLASTIAYQAEPHFFSEMLNKIAKLAGKIAEMLQKMQSGQIRSYVAWMSIGALFLILYLTR